MSDGVVDSFFSNPEGTFFPIPSSVTEIPVVIQAGTQVMIKEGTKVDYSLFCPQLYYSLSVISNDASIVGPFTNVDNNIGVIKPGTNTRQSV